MALYLGNDKVKVNLDGVAQYLNLFADPTITNGVRLVSFDNCVLKDLNCLYITAKESE